jgi:uncharacterized protein
MHTTRNKNGMMATIIGLSALAAVSAPAFAEEKPLREAIIVVSGEGDATVRPDMAMVSLSVVRLEKTAREALDANNTAMTAVIDAMKTAGIAPRDIQTSGFSIDALYDYPQDDKGNALPPVLRGYQVSNGLTLRIRDLAKVGDIMDQAVTLGVNQGGGISFTNDDPKATIEAARKAAMEDAMAKAKLLTQTAGVKLGRVIEISEGGPRPMPQPVAMAMMKEAAAPQADRVPVEAGENNYHITVNVTFGIDQ